VAEPPFHPLPPNGCGGCPGVVEGTVEAAEVKQDEEGAALHAADDLVERPEGVLHRRVVRERKPTAGHVPPTPRRLHGAGMKGGDGLRCGAELVELASRIQLERFKT